MEFDAIIIGSGQAGNPLAEKLSAEGWSVALIERAEFGGTCVNVGCTPTKTLIQRAQIAHYARNSEQWGVHSENVRVEFPKVMLQKNKVVSEWRESVQQKLESSEKIKVFKGKAQFIGENRLRVGREELTSEKIFIDTGASPAIPDIQGLQGTPYLTNETILELKTLPESLVVLGGGYIGLEFGQMFSRFGCHVTILQHANQLIPQEDEDVATELQQALEAEGISIILDAKTLEITYAGEFKIQLEDQVVAASHLLVATGRKPRTADLDLDKCGVEVDNKGAIIVNERLETSQPGIWALGDVKGGPAFTHISYNDFQIVSENLLMNADRSTKGRIVPYCVFTDPQLGGFGMTEKEALATGKKIKVGKIKMADIARAIERDETRGIMKLVVDADTNKILGASVLGMEGGEIVQILSTVAFLDQPYTKLLSAIWIHPTLAEGLFALFDAVE